MLRAIGCWAIVGSLWACSSGSDHASECCGDADISVARANVSRVLAADIAPDDLRNASAANNAFALALYGEVIAEPSAANVLTAPVSASLALTMAYAGANGATKSQMAGALRFEPRAESNIFAGQNALSQALNARAAAALRSTREKMTKAQSQEPDENDYQLSVVNSVWGEQTYTWEKPFLEILASNYGTGVFQQDFVHAFEPARITIDDWVSRQTNSKIDGLLERGALDDRTRLVIVNALHLMLPWDEPFNADNTQEGYFDESPGNSVLVDFMHTVGNLPYADDGAAQVLALPLSNRELSVLIALPHEDVSLAEYEAALTRGNVDLVIPKNSVPVQLSLPKVAFTTPSLSLAEPLKALGMRDAFDPSAADFRGLSAHPPDGGTLYVKDVLQKSMVAMDEHGVEAAAATAVVFERKAAVIDPPLEVNVKRPFVIAIIDEPTGAILMLGHVTDPNDSGGK